MKRSLLVLFVLGNLSCGKNNPPPANQIPMQPQPGVVQTLPQELSNDPEQVKDDLAKNFNIRLDEVSGVQIDAAFYKTLGELLKEEKFRELLKQTFIRTIKISNVYSDTDVIGTCSVNGSDPQSLRSFFDKQSQKSLADGYWAQVKKLRELGYNVECGASLGECFSWSTNLLKLVQELKPQGLHQAVLSGDDFCGYEGQGPESGAPLRIGFKLSDDDILDCLKAHQND